MTYLFELNVDVAKLGSREISSSLYQELKAAILDGRLKSGARLPPTRSAKAALGVSRNTAQQVYERLANEGLVSTRRGSGAYVAPPRPQAMRPATARPPHDARVNDFWFSDEVTASIGFWREEGEGASLPKPRIDLRPGMVDLALFPFATLRQVMAKQLRRLETKPSSLKSPQGNQGSYQLRQAISDHIALTRAVACLDSDVLVTAGAQQAFDLIARILVRPGETVVAIEDPGYPPMRVAFEAAGARLVPVGVDAQGIMIDRIPSEASIICVCPSHQFPLGMTMTIQRRKALLEHARRTGSVIVEDDYDGEFRYDGAPFEALRTQSSADQVFYVGTFSKCMLPSLRLGFVVAPKWAMRALVTAKNATDWHCPLPTQLALAAFIRDGHLARHVRRMRQVYGERRDIVVGLLRGELRRWLKPVPSFYGLHVTALSDEVDCEQLSIRLAAKGVRAHSLQRYHLGTAARSGLIFGLGSADGAQLEEMGRVLIETLAKG